MGQFVLETAHNRAGSSHRSLKITAGSQNNFKKPTCWNLISPFLEVIPRTFPTICPLSSCHEFGSRLQPGFSDQFCSLPFCLSLQRKSRLKWSGLDSVAAHKRYHFYMPWDIWSIPIEVLYMLQDQTVARSLLQWQSKAGEQTPRNSSGTGCSCLGSWVTSHICAAYNRNLGPSHMKADVFKMHPLSLGWWYSIYLTSWRM